MLKNHTATENQQFQEAISLQESQIMIYFLSRDFGTAQEIADTLYERLNSVSTRLSGLVSKGKLVETGYTRLNKKTGRYGTIYAKPYDAEMVINKIKAAMKYQGQSIRKAAASIQSHVEMFAIFGLRDGKVVKNEVVINEYSAMQTVKQYKSLGAYDNVICKKFFKKFNL